MTGTGSLQERKTTGSLGNINKEGKETEHDPNDLLNIEEVWRD